MSGNRERKPSEMPICNMCERKVEYFTIGHGDSPICWVYHKAVEWVVRGVAYTLEAIEEVVDYVYCSECEDIAYLDEVHGDFGKRVLAHFAAVRGNEIVG